jgi:3-dehydroquinate dehydratase-2
VNGADDGGYAGKLIGWTQAMFGWGIEAVKRHQKSRTGQNAVNCGKLAGMKKQKTTSQTREKAVLRPRLLVLHGPNLNLLGAREPQHYGEVTLADINLALARRAEIAEVDLESFQSNHEGALIERIHAARAQEVRYIIINPAAWTHTSVAVRDALAATGIPFIEVHLSNVHARETFRQHSFFSDIAIGVISGLGHQGYLLALEYLLNKLNTD